MKVFLLILAVIEAVVIIALVVSRTKNQKQLKMIMEYAKRISQKDLNVADLPVNGDQNLTTLAEYLNRIKKNIVSFIEPTGENLTVLSDVVEGTPAKRLKIAFFSKLDNYFWYNISVPIILLFLGQLPYCLPNKRRPQHFAGVFTIYNE